MTILFSGGGTLGPVIPLLSVWEALRARDVSISGVWVGTPTGPERAFVEEAGLLFETIPVFRLSRHPSIEWFLLPLRALASLWKAWHLLSRFHPDVVATAGGFTGVPLVWMARMRGIPVWVHAQDVSVTLSLRLTAPFAGLLTTAWKETADRVGSGAELIGNPGCKGSRQPPPTPPWEGGGFSSSLSFGFDAPRPTVLVMGGGGGAAFVNRRVEELLPGWTAWNVIHVTGHQGEGGVASERYAPHALLSRKEMGIAFEVADLVICRAGMGTITDLASFSRAAIFIPLPHSPQEENARMIQAADAGVILSQEMASTERLHALVADLLVHPEKRKALGSRLAELLPTDVGEVLAQKVEKLVKRAKS